MERRSNFTNVAKEVVSLLESGYCLRPQDFGEIAQRHGYSHLTGITEMISRIGAPWFNQITEVPVVKLRYRGRTVYHAGLLDPKEDTDLDRVLSQIDRELASRHQQP